MTFAKILCEIIWFVSRKHLLYPVAMVIQFPIYTFQFFIILILCVKNAIQTIVC